VKNNEKASNPAIRFIDFIKTSSQKRLVIDTNSPPQPRRGGAKRRGGMVKRRDRLKSVPIPHHPVYATANCVKL
jgi:hypothetical protein